MLVVLVFAAAGCSSNRRLARLDAQARGYLRSVQAAEFPGTPPEPLELEAHRDGGQAPFATVLALDLRKALALAARHSRSYQDAREELYSAALSLRAAAHDWEWNATNSLQGLLTRDLEAPDTTIGGDAEIGLSRRFLSGGRLSLSLALDSLRFLTGNREVDITSLAQLTVTQPLLSGAGKLVAREELTQAERDLVYALRSYVRTRKDLLLQVAERYYAVLSAVDSLAIARRNRENLRASRERSEFMGEAGRVPPFQIDQARQDELNAHASVVSREQALRTAEDRLKSTLGLAPTTRIEVDGRDLQRLADAELPSPPMSIEQACLIALRNRLDYATEQDELEDAERAVHIARNALKPKLDLTLSGEASSPESAKLRAIRLRKGTYSAGVDAELPFDRTSELVSYRLALIARDQQQRSVAAKRDEIVTGLRSDWRSLKSAEENYRIQLRSVELAEKRIESTELLFQAGRVDMRDILDARNALIQARNSRTQALVTHRLSWLRLLHDLERLPTDADTLWSVDLEQPPAAGQQ